MQYHEPVDPFVDEPDKDDIAAEEPPKRERVAPHIARFYDRMMRQLPEKGVWGEGQVAQSTKALMLREQNVRSKGFGALVNERFGRLDRKRAVEKLVKDGKAAKVTPRNVRETAGTIHPATVDAMLANLSDELKDTPERVTRTIAGFFGVRDMDVLQRRTLRGKRFMLNRPGRRMPMHVRESAVLSTAIAVAVSALFPEQQTPETLEAVRLLREKHNAPLPAAAQEDA